MSYGVAGAYAVQITYLHLLGSMYGYLPTASCPGMAQFAKLLIVTARAIASAFTTAWCVASMATGSSRYTTLLTIYRYKPSSCLATSGTSGPMFGSTWLLMRGEQSVCPVPGNSSSVPF